MSTQKQWVDGFLIVLIYIALLFMFLTGLPIVDMLAMCVLPLPFVYYTAKYGLRNGFLFVIICVAIGLLLIWHVFIATFFVVIGYVLGALTYKQVSGTDRFVYTGMTVFFFLMGAYLFLLAATDFSLGTLFRESFDQSVRMLEAAGVNSFDENMIETYLSTLEGLTTFLLLLFSCIYAWIVYVFSAMMFRWKGISYKRLPAFINWTFPRLLLIYYMILLLIGLFEPDSGTLLFIVYHSGIAIVSVFLALQGTSFLVKYVQSRRSSPQRKIVCIVGIVLGILLLPIAFYVLKIIGMLDMIFKLRERLQS
ncbi:DUF2232 domain-containing protein [Bacillus sp. FSL W7-1360]